MKRRIAARLSELAGLGRAFLEVLSAEWTALNADLGMSGRLFLRAIILAIVAAGFLAWAVVLLSLALIAFLDRFVEPWQAALIVASGILLIGVILFLRARWVLREVRPPAELVQTRVRDHIDWIRGEIGGASAPNNGEEQGDAGSAS